MLGSLIKMLKDYRTFDQETVDPYGDVGYILNYKGDKAKDNAEIAPEFNEKAQTTYTYGHVQQIPRMLEKSQGLTGIAGTYKMPKGLLMSDLQDLIMILDYAAGQGHIDDKKYYGAMQYLTDQVIHLNPSLQNLDCDKTDISLQRFILMGVASSFNARDIQSFLNGNFWYVLRDDPLYIEARDRIENMTGTKLDGWIPSVQTNMQLYTQLLNRKIERKLHSIKACKRV